MPDADRYRYRHIAEFHPYPQLGHGFGLGVGTTAEGWIDDATAFWAKHIEP